MRRAPPGPTAKSMLRNHRRALIMPSNCLLPIAIGNVLQGKNPSLFASSSHLCRFENGLLGFEWRVGRRTSGEFRIAGRAEWPQ